MVFVLYISLLVHLDLYLMGVVANLLRTGSKLQSIPVIVAPGLMKSSSEIIL